MSQGNNNQTNKDTIKENGIEASPNLNNNFVIEEEEEAEYSDSREIRNKDEKLSSHSKHSNHQNDNIFENEYGSTYSYSSGSNLIRLSQPSSAVNIHLSGSSPTSNNSRKDSKKKNEQSSGCYLHFEPSTIERDLNSDKVFNSGHRSKKSPKNHSQQQQNQKNPKQQAQPRNQQQPRQMQQQPRQVQQQPRQVQQQPRQVQQQPRQMQQQPQQMQQQPQQLQQQPQQMQQQNVPQPIPQYQQRQIQPQRMQQQKSPKRQQNLIDDSPDSYQISDKYADRDVNLNDNFDNDSNEYTYEYFSESNSYYQRNFPQVQLQMQRQQQQQQRPSPLQQQRPSPLQQQRQPNRQQVQQSTPSSGLEDDSEYTYIYEYPSSELDSQYTDNNNNNNNYVSPKSNYNNIKYRNNNPSDDESEYTYTYDSISGLNSEYTDYSNSPLNQPQRQQQQQPRAINAELIPQNVINRGAPLMPIQMQLRVPETPQIEPDSTNDYTYTYDEPTTEEKLLMESFKNRESPLPSPNQPAKNFSISNIPQIEIAPIEPKKKNKPTKPAKSKKNKKMISPRNKQLQDKINKLQKNLEKLDNVSDSEEETVDMNDNTKINSLKDKLAGLTGWRNSPRNGQIQSAYDTNTYTYTFEYESEVFPQKKTADLQLKTQIGVVSIEAAKKPPSVTERDFLLNDENPQKINLSISPAVQSEASNRVDSRKKKAEQLQEIIELKRRLQQLQDEMNENEDEEKEENFSYEEPQVSESDGVPQQHGNKIRVKKRIKVAKQVKISDDLKEQQTKKKAPKMKRVHKRVKIEKNASHHHGHHHHRHSEDGSENGSQKSNNYDNDELVTRDVVLDEDDDESESQREEDVYDESTNLQLLDESSSPASSSTTAALLPFSSPKSPLRLLDEGSDEEEQKCDSLNVHVVDVKGLPDVDTYCIAILAKTGDARKTKTIEKGIEKVFQQNLVFPLRDGIDERDRNGNQLVFYVKKQDLIKNDRLLGKAKIDLDFGALKSGEQIDRNVQLTSDAGIPTQSQVHVIISLHDITSPHHLTQEQPQVTQPTIEREIDLDDNSDNRNRNRNDNDDDDDDNDEDDRRGPNEDGLRPSNCELTSDMKNKLKIHRNNFISPRTNDESGVFILEPPSQSPFEAEPEFEPGASSGFITDLVRSREGTDSKSSKSSAAKQAQKNLNFPKGDKITYNLENDVKVNQRNVTRNVRDREIDLDDSNEYDNENRSNTGNGEIKKKRRIIQKIDSSNTFTINNNDDDDDQANKEPIQIEIDFASTYSELSYQDEYSEN